MLDENLPSQTESQILKPLQNFSELQKYTLEDANPII